MQKHLIKLESISMLQSLRSMEPEQLTTMAGTMMIKFATGAITCWGSINLYILSYFYHQGVPISSSTNSLIILVNIVPISLLILFATKLCDKFGYEVVIRACGLAFILSPFLMYLRFTVATMVIFCILIPVSAYSISSIPIINCLWTQFPKSKNKATAVAVICFGMGGAFWNYLFTVSVNPMNQTTIITDPQTNLSFFGPDVTQRVLSCLKVGYVLCGLLFVAGAWMIRKNNSYEDSTRSGDIQIQMIDKILMPEQKETVSPKNVKKTHKNLKEALMDSRFISIFIISFFTGIYQIFLMMNLKIIYMPIVNDDIFLAYCAITGTAVSIAGAFFWGLIADKYNFYFTLLIFSVLDLLIKIYGRFATNPTTIMLLFIFIGFVDKAMLTIMGPGLVRIFGISTGTQLLPYKGFSVFLGFLVAPLGYILLQSQLDPLQYLFGLVIFSVFSVLLSARLYQNERSRRKLQQGN